MSESRSIEDCPQCGGTMTRVAAPSPGRRLWRWFNYGRRQRGQVDYECRTCGHGLSMTTFFVGGSSIRRSSIRRRIGDVRSQRVVEPVPLFYAIVGTVGVILGWLVSRIWGRRHARWQVPVAALGTSWLFMESSAFWRQPLAVRE